MANQKIQVKGVFYYKGLDCYRKGSLLCGDSVLLKHEPNNKYDRHAVAVILRKNGEMLGHIPKELAPRIANFVLNNKIIGTEIRNIDYDGKYFNIFITVKYDSLNDTTYRNNSILWKQLSSLSDSQCVYILKNIKNNKCYVGSTKNFKDRIRSHINALIKNNHTNMLLATAIEPLEGRYNEATFWPV